MVKCVILEMDSLQTVWFWASYFITLRSNVLCKMGMVVSTL